MSEEEQSSHFLTNSGGSMSSLLLFDLFVYLGLRLQENINFLRVVLQYTGSTSSEKDFKISVFL